MRFSTCKGKAYNEHKTAIDHFFYHYPSYIKDPKANTRSANHTGEHDYKPLPRYRLYTYDNQSRTAGDWNPVVGQTVRKKGFIIKAVAKIEGTLYLEGFKRTNLLLFLEDIDPNSKTAPRWKWQLNDDEVKYFNK